MASEDTRTLVTATTAGYQREQTDGFLPIEAYSAIGDCRTMALVGSDSSIDWFCWPQFESAPLFARLLDPHGGYFAISPTCEFRSRAKYRPDTNVLETEFHTPGGTCRITDLFAAVPREFRRRMLLPETLIVRKVEGLRGMVPLSMSFEPYAGLRGDYVHYRRTGDCSVVTPLQGRNLLHLASDVPVTITGPAVSAQFSVEAGEDATFSLALTADEPAIFPPLKAVNEIMAATHGYWRSWASRCTSEVPHRELVMRSALALKLLSHAPSGAIIAAPTTSLPEVQGGERNWDYRYCWLRDASLTVRAFMHLGYEDEARAFTQWMLHATRLTRPRVQVLYDAYGRQPAPERDLPGLNGYRGAKPVRTGNGASDQAQLDIYGEVLDAVEQCYGSDGELARDERGFVEDLAKYVLENWHEPDHGIWEIRGPRKHYVDSKVMCWLALERAAQLAERRLINLDADRLRSSAAAIRDVVETSGYSPKLGAFRQALGEDLPDAASLRMPVVGFCRAGDPLMASTIDLVNHTLGRGELVYRRTDQVNSGEGAFVACSFWMVDCLARQGRIEEATAAFDALAARANHAGLYAEEIDEATGAFLGNFPLAFSHTALVNAALTLGREGNF